MDENKKSPTISIETRAMILAEVLSLIIRTEHDDKSALIKKFLEKYLKDVIEALPLLDWTVEALKFRLAEDFTLTKCKVVDSTIAIESRHIKVNLSVAYLDENYTISVMATV